MMPWRRAVVRRGAAAGAPPARADPADLSGLAIGYVVGSTAGGTGRHVRMLADGCAARGAAVTVFTPGGRPPGPPGPPDRRSAPSGGGAPRPGVPAGTPPDRRSAPSGGGAPRPGVRPVTP